MAYWNNRVMRHTDTFGVPYYTIHEVYYDDSDQPEGWTSTPIYPSGTTINELRAELNQMLASLDKPILDYPSE
jgi:hypothetical protein